MDTSDLIELFHREMSKPYCDARAEPILALAMEKGIPYENVMICCDSLFFREYSKDIFYTEPREDARKNHILELHLSRSGIYDQLPEGLFFQPGQADRHVSNAGEMAAEYKISQQKEQGIRRFFQPFENDFFWQRVQLEIEEARMLEGLESGILNDYFAKFWGLPASIPKPFIVPLILLFPYAGKIAGNPSLTSKCLELLLHETVQIKQVPAIVTDAKSFFEQKLGKQQFGIDMVCGEEFIEDYPVLELTVGPLQNSQICDYLEDGKRFALLQTFYQFFVPAGTDIVTKIEVSTDKRNMYLETNFEPVLGYSSVL